MNKRIQTLKRLAVLLYLFLSLATSLPPVQAQNVPASESNDVRELEVFLDRLLAEQMAREHIPGAVIVLVKDGRIFFSKGYGFANVERRTPVAPDRTIFRIGSITKVFTATAVMQLADRGSINMSDDVNRHLRDIRVPNTYPQPVTFANLLTHTAGFDEINSGRHALSADRVLPLKDFLRERLIRIRPPNEISSYGTYGIALAGHLVETISGLSYREYLQRNIFSPLGMERTSVAAVPPNLQADLATGYSYSGGRYRPQEFEYFHSFPASDINSTASEMTRFMITHLQQERYGEARILSERAAEEMHRQQFTHHPRLAGWAYGFRELYQNGQRALWHGGSMEGYAALMFLIPRQNWGVFIACNRETAALGEEVKNALMDRYFPYQVRPDPPKPSSQLGNNLNRFAGTYRTTEYCHTCRGIVESFVRRKLAPSFSIKVNNDNTLSLWRERLIQVEPLLFKVAGDRGYIAFREDREGRIRYMLAGQSSFEREH